MSQELIEQLVAGALFDFAGFLTTMDKPATFSGRHDAAVAVELLSEWAAKRGLNLDEARVKDWSATLRQPAARVDVTDAMAVRAIDARNQYIREHSSGLAVPAMRAAIEAALSAQPAPERQGECADVHRCLAFRAGARWADANPGNSGEPRVMQVCRESNTYAETPYPWTRWPEPATHPAAPVGVPDGDKDAQWALRFKAAVNAIEDEEDQPMTAACAMLMIDACVKKNAKRVTLNLDGVERKDGTDLGDWTVTVERKTAAPSAPQGTQQGAE